MNVGVGRYALGVASLLIVCGSLAIAAVSLRRRFFAAWTGPQAWLAESVMALALLIAVLEALGTIGLFRLGPIVATCLLVGAGAAVSAGRSAPRVDPRGGARFGERLPAKTLAVLAAATTAAAWASPTLQSYDVGIRTFDSLWYHLPWAANFAQTGHVTQLHFDVEFLLAFYPATAELLHGLGIVLLGRDTLSPALNLLWLALALLAAWCLGRSRGRGALALTGVALVMATPMMVFSQPGSADGDVLGVFLLLAAVALLTGGENRRAAQVVAAVAAGLAVGIKLTLLAPVLALTVGVIAIASRGRRVSVAGLWLGPLLLAGGFWYLRNLIAEGNPLPWVGLGILPTPAPPLQGHVTFAVAHYLTDSRFWSHFFVAGMASQLGGWWYAILVGAILGPVLCLLPGADRTLRMLALVALAGLGAYLVTPNSAMGPPGDPVGFAFNLRFGAPALALSFALLPLAPAFAGARRQATLAIALLALLAATVGAGSLWPSAHLAGALCIGLASLLVGLIFARMRAEPRHSIVPAGRLRRIPTRAAVVAAVGATLGAGAAAGYAWQGHYLRGRYAFAPGVSYLARVWAMFRTVHHASVGVVGTYGGYFSYPLFGLDDSNRVQYIASHGPRGSFAPIKTCREWRAAVDAGHFRYLVTTPGRDIWAPRVLTPSPEGAWTRSDRSARLVLTRRATGQRIDVFELRGPLDPAACR